MKWVKDVTGRFPQRPHYSPRELDEECERIISDFLRRRRGTIDYPIATDDLYVLLEQETSDLDPYADLSNEGLDVEGVTDFCPGRKPQVRIARDLSEDPRRENRLRTTLTHELGHVKFHNFLWAFHQAQLDARIFRTASPRCKRETILSAHPTDWMEWQAGHASGAFLMPISPLKEMVVALRGESNHMDPIRLGSETAQELIRRVQERFQVSSEAARVRLLRCEYVVEGSPNASLFGAGLTAE